MNEFFRELADLLDKHKVEILAADEYTGYPECGEDIQIRIESTDDYNYLSIPMGEYIDSKLLRSKL